MSGNTASIDPIRVEKSQLKDLTADYDIFVLDDPLTFGWLQESGITAKQRVFYCHGFYNEVKDPPTFNFLKRNLASLPIIFSTDLHRREMEAWVNPMGPSLIAGRRLDAPAF